MTSNENDRQMEAELDFNSDDSNGFYYTSEKAIRKMDDAFVISKLAEKYPDFSHDTRENSLKRVMITMVADTRHMAYVMDECSIDIYELMMVIYRNFSYVFNKCFISKIRNLMSRGIHGKKRLARRK